MQIDGVDYTEEELYVLRLWHGYVMSYHRLRCARAILNSQLPDKLPGFMDFLQTDLCKKFTGNPSLALEKLLKLEVMEAFGIKPLRGGS